VNKVKSLLFLACMASFAPSVVLAQTRCSDCATSYAQCQSTVSFNYNDCMDGSQVDYDNCANVASQEYSDCLSNCGSPGVGPYGPDQDCWPNCISVFNFEIFDCGASKQVEDGICSSQYSGGNTACTNANLSCVANCVP
jgi:hypothetical protein